MYYLVKNGERVSFAMSEHDAKKYKEYYNTHTDDSWDIMYVDNEEVNAIYLLSDLRERFLDYDVDMYDISTEACRDYAGLLETAIDIIKNHHERRYLI